MTDAPERIWVYAGSVLNGTTSWEWGLSYQTDDMEDEGWPNPVEFVRADLMAGLVDVLDEAKRELEELTTIYMGEDYNSPTLNAALAKLGVGA